uniref:NAD(P)/FAD-dependent oxidoreductase n=1 Tax=Candidatus Cryptobacteroides bacterium TaxID=3085639 RepID=UPI003FEEDA1B
MLKVAIIGGGAAGCFAAVNIKELNPDIDVTVYEAGAKLLAKVAVTGGGRCNLTNSFAQVRSLESVYPRGHRLMKRLLKEFSNADVCGWFEARGVRLLTQPDQCVFPVSQDAMEIVNALLSGMRNAGVHIQPRHKVLSVIDISTAGGPRYKLSFAPDPDGTMPAGIEADIVLVTTGGSPKKSGLSMLDGLGLDIIDPLPSLFSFNIGDAARPGENVRNAGLSALMGTVVENAMAGIVGTKFR